MSFTISYPGRPGENSLVEQSRLTLRANGFVPTPCAGKRPVLKDWQKRTDPTDHEILGWSRSSPAALNTGILTRSRPTFDIDILNPDAAQAVEDLTRQWFKGGLGRILVRTGNAPKRCIPFLTDKPFKKIAATFVEGGKLEFLGDGQQFVALGDHPDTGLPYQWEGDVSPLTVKFTALPVIREDEARDLVDAAVKLLVENFGYRLPTKPRRADAGQDGKSRDGGGSLEARLRGVLKAVESAKEGERNNVLFWAACRVAEMLLDNRGLSEGFCAETLRLVARRIGLPDVEIELTLSSGLKSARRG